MSSMKKITLCLVLVLALLQATQAARVSDTITHSDQFQTDLDELDGKNEDSKVVNILKLLNIHIQRNKGEFNISSLDWYKIDAHPPTSNQMRILIVISNFEGLYMNSGIGTFYAALSEFLASQGHSVTLLYTRVEDSESMLFTRWQNNYKKKGISIARLPESPVKITSSPIIQRSYQVYAYLKQHANDYDVVQFPDHGGAAYYSLLAKYEGLAFESTRFIVGLHGSLKWMNRMEGDFDATAESSLEQEFMERRSAELTDVLWAPSAEIVEWLSNQGWSLPSASSGNFFLMPLLPVTAELPRSTARSGQVKEIVFFGKLQRSKGLELFCDALDKIASVRPDLSTLKITFLGKIGTIDEDSADEYLQKRAENGWKFKINVFNKDRKGALDYIRDPSRAVVIPSYFDNAPYTLYECLYSGVPFVASNIPSIAAVIAPEDRTKVLFDANVAASLSAKIQEMVEGGISPARPVYPLSVAKDMWASLYDVTANVEPTTEVVTPTPLVSVCITHYNRPQFLEMALKSIEEQTYKNIEVVLVDDGSDDADAKKYLSSLDEKFKAKGWKIERTANQFLGAARNHAVSKSSGEYVVFLDDDNYVKPEQVATYVRVAGVVGADALTSIHDVFHGFGVPDQQTHFEERSIPLGAAAAVGLFKNCFGDANFFIKKSVFTSLGGFTVDRDVGQEDHEFLAKLVLAGHILEMVPEPLLYYRMHNDELQMRTNTDPLKNQARSLRSYDPVISQSSLTFEEAVSAIRSKRDAYQTCNLTITSIVPQTISTGARPTIKFSVSVLDCPIQTVSIGQYQCTNIQTQSSPSGSSFTCVSPSVTYPGAYSVTVAFTTGGLYRASQDIYYVQNPNQAQTTSSGLGVVSYSPNNRARSTSSCPFEDAFDQVACKLEAITCLPAGPLVDLAACNYDSSTGYYSIKVSFIGASALLTSQQLIQTFQSLINDSAWAAIGIRFITFSSTGSCTPSGCVCNPNYGGVDCSIPVQCPNNCSLAGTCVDGTYGRICQCQQGFTGSDCSIAACPLACSGRGTCVVAMGSRSGTCQCNLGYFGAGCQNGTSPCPDGCSGHGTCVGTSCSCNAGYHGNNCAVTYTAIEKQAVLTESSGESKGAKAALAITITVAGLMLIAALILSYLVWKRRQNERR